MCRCARACRACHATYANRRVTLRERIFDCQRAAGASPDVVLPPRYGPVGGKIRRTFSRDRSAILEFHRIGPSNAVSKYAIQFGLMSITAAVAAVFGIASLPARVVLIWVAVALAVVAFAYLRTQPSLLGKRADGSQHWTAWLVLWPYFVLARLSFWLYRVSSRNQPPVAEVRPGVWFAQRLTRRELRDAGVKWTAVLDLAAEFPRVAAGHVRYRSLPLLDGAVPSATQIQDGVSWIDAQHQHGNVLVHCALGHGRSGSIVLAWLLRHGHVPDLKAGVADLKARRPTFGLSRGQRAFVGTQNWRSVPKCEIAPVDSNARSEQA